MRDVTKVQRLIRVEAVGEVVDPDNRFSAFVQLRYLAAGLSRVPRPHGLRHPAITSALDAGRDVRDVRKYSRHAKLETVLVYDDNRTDVAGDIAAAVAEDAA